MSAPTKGQRSRGDFLLSWVFLASLVALLVNDFYLKAVHPGAVSGILSDVAGMVFFPVFLVAVGEFIAWLLPGRPMAGPSWFVVAAVFIGVSFVVVKFTAVGNVAYVGAVSTVIDLVSPGGGKVVVVPDPWDALALLALPLPVMVGRHWR